MSVHYYVMDGEVLEVSPEEGAELQMKGYQLYYGDPDEARAELNAAAESEDEADEG